uniref:Type II secretory pathway pseudopilin PulG n=1 Tax=Rhodocyclus tenuis TaxID=1066 RepID=A0A840G7I8_RHOTE|nr:type II secretory pathway pseudopilin PulG [Rhodocyclus tenuis]
MLVIVGLLLGGMMVSLSTLQENRNDAETKRQLDETREALIGFAVANGRLPRPAVSATDGTERGLCASDTQCTGFIPWQVLGTQRADSRGKLIRYSVSPDFANATFNLSSKASKKVQTRDNTGTSVYLVGQAAACNSTDQACSAAVVFSHGSKRFGTSIDGTALSGVTASNTDEQANDTGSINGTLFMARTPTDNTEVTGGEFDDILVWIPPFTLYNRMIAAGRLP